MAGLLRKFIEQLHMQHWIRSIRLNQLKIAWVYHTGDAFEGNSSTIQCNPLIVNSMMYVTSPQLKLIALNLLSGKQIWKFNPAPGH